MYDLSVIIAVDSEDRHIGLCIERIGRIFQEEHIRGEILVLTSPRMTITNSMVRENKTTSLYPVTILDTGRWYQQLPGLFHHVDARDILFIAAPDARRISAIPEIYRRLRDGYDLVIGSRYLVKDDAVSIHPSKGPFTRSMRILAGLFFPNVSDPLSDIFSFRKELMDQVPIRLEGGAILLEILGKCPWKNLSEVPVQSSRDLTGGACGYSLASLVIQVVRIGWYALVHHESPAWNEQGKIIRFIAVGVSGILVNMSVLYLLTSVIGVFYLVSSFIAIELSILNNFFWNDRWTFATDPKHRLLDPWHRLGVYHLVSVGGMLINIGILFLLTDIFGIYYLVSNMIGILAAFSWNFILNRHTTWKPDCTWKDR